MRAPGLPRPPRRNARRSRSPNPTAGRLGKARPTPGSAPSRHPEAPEVRKELRAPISPTARFLLCRSEHSDLLLPDLIGAETRFHAGTRISATQPTHLVCAGSATQRYAPTGAAGCRTATCAQSARSASLAKPRWSCVATRTQVSACVEGDRPGAAIPTEAEVSSQIGVLREFPSFRARGLRGGPTPCRFPV